ncbi:pseudouridine synthase [Atractiella rhizophila]|nr:pseudouridine synthase [Atractiella rhizophila]
MAERKGSIQTHKVGNSWEKPVYYFENGLRKVQPYEFIYRTYVKERWIGKTILKVFSTEFRDRSKSYYEHHLLSGKVLLNGKTPASLDTVLKNGDYIENAMHRHEPPVAAVAVKVVSHDEEKGILIVDKMGSVPIHSTGRYHHNTMLHILRHEHNFPLVRTCNRLDRLTSGVMVCATTVEAGRKLAKYFNPNTNRAHKEDPAETEAMKVRKEYVARVVGCFPTEEITCEEPLLSIDKQIGINVVHPQGRPSKTIFKRLSHHPDTDTSVVHCFPITGRTHQIRVHLQYLGYPIANDPIYNNSTAWGPDKARGGVFRDALEAKTRALDVDAPEGADVEEQEKRLRAKEQRFAEQPSVPKPGFDPLGSGSTVPGSGLNEQSIRAITELRKTRDEEENWGRWKDAVPPTPSRDSSVRMQASDAANGDYCMECGVPLIPDPRQDQLCIWLHALRYHCRDWDYSSELPEWAREEWTPDALWMKQREKEVMAEKALSPCSTP